MKVGGFYMAISYGDPQSRVFHMEREFLSWNIKTYKLFEMDAQHDNKEAQDKTHYVYCCEKLEGADLQSKRYYNLVMR